MINYLNKDFINEQFIGFCKAGDLDMVKHALLECGADVNAQEDKGFIEAMLQGHKKITQYLLASPELEKHTTKPIAWNEIIKYEDTELCKLYFQKFNWKNLLPEIIKICDYKNTNFLKILLNLDRISSKLFLEEMYENVMAEEISKKDDLSFMECLIKNEKHSVSPYKLLNECSKNNNLKATMNLIDNYEFSIDQLDTAFYIAKVEDANYVFAYFLNDLNYTPSTPYIPVLKSDINPEVKELIEKRNLYKSLHASSALYERLGISSKQDSKPKKI